MASAHMTVKRKAIASVKASGANPVSNFGFGHEDIGEDGGANDPSELKMEGFEI